MIEKSNDSWHYSGFFNSDKMPDEIFSWNKRNVKITKSNGTVVYEGKNLEFPENYSDLAVRIIGSKYLYVGDDKKNPIETSHKQLIHRVADSISHQGLLQGLLDGAEKDALYKDIYFLTLNQSMAFNSPVWFNVGLNKSYSVTEKKDPNNEEESSHWAFVDGKFSDKIDAYERPQGSACFIQSIRDNMGSILSHAKKEGMLFKYGSGTGTNFSTLRGINEPLSGGGIASGMMSFMRIYDIGAGRIQSGGKTRRAAKMVICDDNHPDFLRFITWKVNEERKALWLCANPEWGPKDSFDLDSEAYKTVDGQNGNNSVRLSNAFMNAALREADWDLIFRTADRFEEEIEIPLKDYKDDRQLPDKRYLISLTNKRKTVSAKRTLELIARAASATGDPGVQYEDNINEWNTCSNSGRIRASNPCSEFMFLDDSACNLASINLMKYLKPNGDFDVNEFKKAVETTIIAQEILVDYSSYPSKEVAQNSHKFRPLGLGYANLGSVLMSRGLAYDSDEGRAIASAITSLMTAKAYETSVDLASKFGPFEEFEKNKEPMLSVIQKHFDYAKKIKKLNISGLENILEEGEKVWSRVLDKGSKCGFRNSQVTLLAPTGTIGFMMDLDCTGIEPMIGLKSSKGLAGGGGIERDLAPSVVNGLISLGYEGSNLEGITKYISENASVIDAPHLKKEHYNVFATSLGDNTISVDGHLKMMAAVQPFLSGAISKTVNLPAGSSVEEIRDLYIKAWQLGLKSVTPYVDGSKGVQPVNVLIKKDNENSLKWGDRKKPEKRLERIGWNVDIGNTGVHFIVGEYGISTPKEAPADFFVEFGGSGSSFTGIYTSWAKEASWNRQRGESLEEFVKHNLGATGTIKGFTNHPFIKSCSSIEDFFAKLIMFEYLGDDSMCDVRPTSEDLENIRCNQLARSRRIEHYRSRIKFIDNVMNEGKIGEIFPLLQDEMKNGDIPMGETFCPACGSQTVLSGANCRKCPNCGEAGGCG